MSKITTDNFEILQQKGQKILTTLPTLEKVFTHYNNTEWAQHLQERALLLREGMLSAATITELCTLAQKVGVTQLASRVLTHRPSFSAIDKQQVLPPAVNVQKTISMKIGERYVLCTGISDWLVSSDLKKFIAKQLSLPSGAARNVVINPPAIDPIVHLGMWPGMVSPFLGVTPPDNLNTIIILQPPAAFLEQEFAISISLYESLLLPARYFTTIVSDYLAAKQPALRVIVYDQAAT